MAKSSSRVVTTGMAVKVDGACPICRGAALVAHWGSRSKWMRVNCPECGVIWAKKGETAGDLAAAPAAAPAG